MATNDPLKSVENIVQLPRRTNLVPTLNVPRAQPLPPVLFESWVSARDRAAAALLGGAKRLLLTGPAGTGKTVLADHVARVLRAAGRTVIIQLADADPAPPQAGQTLFVDEADRLSGAKLQQLLKDAAGTVVLVGLEPLVRRVAAGTMHLTLEPLGVRGAQEYIAQWLALNGRTPAELDGKAVRVLVELSGGVPRLLSTLLAAGAWLAKSSDAPVIEAVHIQEAAELRSVLGPPPPDDARDAAPSGQPKRVMWSAVLAVVVLAGTAAAIAPRLFPAEYERAVAQAMPFALQAERWLRNEPPRPVQPATPPPVALPPPVVIAPVEVKPIEPPHIDPAPVEPAPVAQTPVAPVPVAEEPPKPADEPPPAERAPEPVQAAPEIPQAVAVVPPEPVAPPPPPPKAPVAAPSPALPVETINFLLRRGHEMLAIDDLSAARLLFLRAAEGGSAEAMYQLGQTYDPAIRTSLAAPGQSDRAEALRWYRKAAELGNDAAARLLPKP